MNQQQLNSRQLRDLKRIIDSQPNFQDQGKLGHFFDLYLVCEATARKLIYYYNGNGDHRAFIVTTVKTATEVFFHNQISEIDIENIFRSGNANIGSRTCRQLRNKYIHDLSASAREEIENRFSDLKSKMENWINLFH